MEPAPVPSFTARILLTAFFLTSWNLPVTTQPTVESVPPNVVEGGNVLLLAHNGTDSVKNYQWYKGQGAVTSQLIATYQPEAHTNSTGPAYSHRETIYPNGSLLLEKVTLTDTGFYTLQTIDAEFKNHLASVQFHVYQEVSKPSIQASNTTVMEQDFVVFHCLSNDKTTIFTRWIFKGQSLKLTERMTLTNNNNTLKIEPVQTDDGGDYQCEVFNPVSFQKSDILTLIVIANPAQGDSQLSAGAIAGIVIGVVAGVALIAALAYFLCSGKFRSETF